MWQGSWQARFPDKWLPVLTHGKGEEVIHLDEKRRNPAKSLRIREQS